MITATSHPAAVRVGEPGGDQRALHAVAAVRRCGGGARELGDAVGDAEIGAAREHAVAEGGVADAARGGEVAFGVLDGFAGELVVPGQALGVLVRAGVGDDRDPGVELVVGAAADLDPGWRDPLRVAVQREARGRSRTTRAGSRGRSAARRSPESARCASSTWVGAPRSAKAFSTTSSSAALGTPSKPRPDDLVERRVGLGEARHPARDRDRGSLRCRCGPGWRGWRRR